MMGFGQDQVCKAEMNYMFRIQNEKKIVLTYGHCSATENTNYNLRKVTVLKSEKNDCGNAEVTI